MTILLLLVLVAIQLPSFGQKVDNNHHNHTLHWVELTDKQNTPYSIFRPQEFLSARAIERREQQGILIEENDLPISPNYLKAIEDLGIKIHAKSKWLNAVAVYTKDQEILAKIANFPFVKQIFPLGKARKVSKININKTRPKVDIKAHQIDYYGLANNQIKMLGGDILHQYGFTGEGVQLAVFDGGFSNVYRMPVFDSIYKDSRLLGTHDFVEGDDYVYESSSHGTHVLSCIGAKAPHLMVGTAPDASFYLFKTEDVKGEFRAEEFNWVAALEHADSIGVDVVNSSLGYTGFNDTTMSYKYHQLDGKTAISSRGANIGASKGIIIVNSAGNEGDGAWHYIGTPADAPGVLSIAAVRSDGKRARFSSWGPTYDGRIKPDVAAQGQNAMVAAMNRYAVRPTNGTSFSSPIMAGMVASLKSAFPYATSNAIKEAVRMSGHQSSEPDSSLGYGIPNFFFAYVMLLEGSIIMNHEGQLYYTPKPIEKEMHIFVEQKEPADIEVTVYNKLMQQQFHHKTYTEGREIKEVKIENLETFPKGVYLVRLAINNAPVWVELVKS